MASTVLIVDDDPLQREIAAEMLGAHGYVCALAEDGEIALQVMAASPADLVLLDVIMPNKEGVETLRELKARWPSIPVVMITGGTARMPSDSLLAVARAFGADAGLSKPLVERPFIDLVRQLLEPPETGRVRLMIRCPERNIATPTGLAMTPLQFNMITLAANNRLACRACGQSHLWSRRDAWLEDC